MHICIDDATRLADVEVLGDEKATSCIGFLKRALRSYAAHGGTVERLMTDNGSAYRSTMHATACRVFGNIGSLALITATIGAGVALRRHADAPLAVAALVGLSGFLITAHPPPYGPIGLALFSAAVLLLARSRTAARASGAGTDGPRIAATLGCRLPPAPNESGSEVTRRRAPLCFRVTSRRQGWGAGDAWKGGGARAKGDSLLFDGCGSDTRT